MRVDRTDVNSVQNNDTSDTKKAGHAAKAKNAKHTDKTGHAAAPSHGDAVKADLSASGKDFAKAHAVATHAPDTREDKIAEIKKRIAEGKYHVDAEAVADRMVDEHLETGLS